MTLSENNQPPSTQVDKEHQRSSDRMDKDQVDRLFHRYKSTKEELEGWRLTVNDGRQTWDFSSTPTSTLSFLEKYHLGIPTTDASILDDKSQTSAAQSAQMGFNFFKQLQTDDGHVAGEYGGPMFLIPGLVITMYITNAPYKPRQKEELIRYIKNKSNGIDGGWGIHTEGHSTVFGTALNYVALRLLGCTRNDPVCIQARETLLSMGGATGIPAWGKFWLAVLNVYEYAGMSPVPPELWLLPEWVPIHPSKMWIHTRQVYLPMGYLYGIKYQAQESDLILELRNELYLENYSDIRWTDQRNNIAKEDV